MKRMTLVAGLLALAGCTDSDAGYDPGIAPGDFVQGVTHPYFPLPVGARWVYESAGGDGVERVEVVVLSEARTIMGVRATVVHDTVTVDGELREDTRDWYAQDRDGNVWYLGEDTAEYEDGEVVSREGSWEWGVDGALPGIAMKADPRPDGEAYYQEYYAGEAEDQAEVVARNRTVSARDEMFSDTVTTREWTALDPGVEELKHYARGVGLVVEEVTKGAATGQREALVSYDVP